MECRDGTGMDITSHEVGVEFLRAKVTGQGAAAGDHPDRDGGAVVLRLHVAEAEAHRLEVVGQNVGNAVLGAADFDARGEGVGGVGTRGAGRSRAEVCGGTGNGLWPVRRGHRDSVLRGKRDQHRTDHRATTSARSITAPSCTASTISMPSTTSP